MNIKGHVCGVITIEIRNILNWMTLPFTYWLKHRLGLDTHDLDEMAVILANIHSQKCPHSDPRMLIAGYINEYAGKSGTNPTPPA